MGRPKDRKERAEMEAVPVFERIERKRAYYHKLAHGIIVPERWADVRRSLASIRRWHEPEIGMIEVPNPNYFVPSHPECGDLISDLKASLTKINKTYPKKTVRPKYISKTKDVEIKKAEKVEAEAQLKDVIAQWHAERQVNEDHQVTIDSLRLQLNKEREKRAEREKENLELRKGHLRLV